MNKLVIIAAAAIVIYLFVLNPQTKEKVNTTTMNSIKSLGTTAIHKISETIKNQPSNTTCDATGNCTGT